MATPCTRSLWDVKVGGTSMEEMRGTGFAVRGRDADRDDGFYRKDVMMSKARRGDGEYERLYEKAEGRYSRGTHGHSQH